MNRGKLGRAALVTTLHFAAIGAIALMLTATPSAQFASAAETKTWTGEGANNNWSTAANWSPSGAPVAGDTLVFPSGAARQTNTNDLADGTSFAVIEFTGGTYTISGNDIQLGDGLLMTDGVATVDLDIGGASGGVQVTDGNLRLNGANTFGATVQLDDGRLIAGSNGALGTTAGATLLSGGILELVDGVTTAEPLVAQDSNSEVMSNGAVVLSGNINLEATIAFVPESGNMRLDGVISGGGSFIKAGTGGLTLTAANTYSGTTTVEAGTLFLSAAGKLGSGAAATTVDAGATLALQNAATIEGEDVTISGTGAAGVGAIRVLGAGSTADDITLAANATIAVETGATFEIETGLSATSPSFVLTKAGPGSLLVSDAASVDIDIVLAAGVLAMDANSSGNLTATGGTLRGHGSFDDVVFDGGGRLLPGDAGEGRLESNTLVAEAGVTFSFLASQSGSGSFWVDGSGASIALGGATLEVLGSADVTAGTTHVILHGPAGSISGTFAGLPDDAVFADAAGRFWRIDYTNGATHTVSIVALGDLEADLSVQLTSNPTVPQDTQNFLLNVVLTNEAATAMPAVKVNITLPNGVEYVSGPAGCVAPDDDDVPQVVVCTVNSLAAGQTTITLTLKVTAPQGGTLLFFAQIDWPGDDPDASNDSDSHSVNVTAPVEFPFRYFLPQVASDGVN